MCISAPVITSVNPLKIIRKLAKETKFPHIQVGFEAIGLRLGQFKPLGFNRPINKSCPSPISKIFCPQNRKYDIPAGEQQRKHDW